MQEHAHSQAQIMKTMKWNQMEVDMPASLSFPQKQHSKERDSEVCISLNNHFPTMREVSLFREVPIRFLTFPNLKMDLNNFLCWL